MNALVDEKKVPESILPFGFKGIPVIKTNDTLTDTSNETVGGGSTGGRIAGIAGSLVQFGSGNSIAENAILPPLPLRFKCTKGSVALGGATGAPGAL